MLSAQPAYSVHTLCSLPAPASPSGVQVVFVLFHFSSPPPLATFAPVPHTSIQSGPKNTDQSTSTAWAFYDDSSYSQIFRSAEPVHLLSCYRRHLLAPFFFLLGFPSRRRSRPLLSRYPNPSSLRNSFWRHIPPEAPYFQVELTSTVPPRQLQHAALHSRDHLSRPGTPYHQSRHCIPDGTSSRHALPCRTRTRYVEDTTRLCPRSAKYLNGTRNFFASSSTDQNPARLSIDYLHTDRAFALCCALDPRAFLQALDEL